MHASMLTTLQEQASQLGKQRQDQATDAFQQGLGLLQRAVQQQLRPGDLLEQSRQAFLKANKLAPSRPEPFLGIAYLLILFQRWPQAQVCLHKLLALDPAHTEAQELLSFVTAQLRATATQALPTQARVDRLPALAARTAQPPRVRAEPDSKDELSHELVSRRILNLARDCQKSEAAGLTLELAGIEARAQSLANLQAQYAVLRQDIQILSAEEDTLSLSRQLVPLERALHRCTQLLMASRRQQTLAAELEALVKDVKSMSQDLERGETPPACERQLEAWLDRCDGFADQIDACEQDRQDISRLTASYNQLVKCLEDVQDLVEDLA